MTRQQAKDKLISFGIAEPTEDQITDFLNTVGKETKAAEAKAEKLQEEKEQLQQLADEAEALRKEKEEVEQGKLTEMEQLRKELEKSTGRVAELEKAQAIASQRNAVVEKFNVTSKQAMEILKDDGTMDYDVLGQIIAEKETAAAAAKEQELLKDTPNPGGGKNGEDGKSMAERLVERSASKQKPETDILSHYV